MSVFQPSGSFSANSPQFASRAASRTSSSVASLRPRRMFSRMLLSKSVTSWNTMEYSPMSFSGSTLEMSIPPTVMLPFW